MISGYLTRTPRERLEVAYGLCPGLEKAVKALKAYRNSQPQCECSEHSGCAMAAARAEADRALATIQSMEKGDG